MATLMELHLSTLAKNSTEGANINFTLNEMQTDDLVAFQFQQNA